MILFVDMDEVMADTYGHFLDLYNAEFSAKLRIEEIEGGEAWQNVPEAHQQRVKQYHWEEGFFRDLRPIADSQEVLGELNRKYEVFVATAAMQFPNSLREKSDWLDEHFPFIHWNNRILCGSKAILRGDILIDDRSYNLENFSGRSIMFASPHNNGSEDFEKVHNWRELGQLLL